MNEQNLILSSPSFLSRWYIFLFFPSFLILPHSFAKYILSDETVKIAIRLSLHNLEATSESIFLISVSLFLPFSLHYTFYQYKEFPYDFNNTGYLIFTALLSILLRQKEGIERKGEREDDVKHFHFLLPSRKWPRLLLFCFLISFPFLFQVLKPFLSVLLFLYSLNFNSSFFLSIHHSLLVLDHRLNSSSIIFLPLQIFRIVKARKKERKK